MQQGSVTCPRIPWTHKSSFQWVQSLCIKEHGKQHVFYGSGPGYNQNSLFDCLEQQCSTYPNSSHHSPDLAFQVSPHGSQPFLNRTTTKLGLANGWRPFWHWHSLALTQPGTEPSAWAAITAGSAFRTGGQEAHPQHTHTQARTARHCPRGAIICRNEAMDLKGAIQLQWLWRLSHVLFCPNDVSR